MIHVKNVRVVDGTGAPAFWGELLWEGDTLQAVSRAPLGDLDAQTIDGQGRVACPGYSEIARHCDLAALYDPDFGRWSWPRGSPRR